MSEPFEFAATSGTARAAISFPAGDARHGAVIVVHEWWGLNDDMRQTADRLAAEGFVALAVDVFDGATASDTAEAMRLVQALKTPDAMKVVEGAVKALAAHPRCNGRVAITGFCVGGAMALAAACNVEGLSAVIPFYGIPRAEYADWTKVRAPIEGHYGAHDGSIPAARAQGVADAVNAAGGSMTLHLYEAGHAFMRAGDPGVYVADAAKLAWSRTVDFLRRTVG